MSNPALGAPSSCVVLRTDSGVFILFLKLVLLLFAIPTGAADMDLAYGPFTKNGIVHDLLSIVSPQRDPIHHDTTRSTKYPNPSSGSVAWRWRDEDTMVPVPVPAANT